jgi:hypothetical protein
MLARTGLYLAGKGVGFAAAIANKASDARVLHLQRVATVSAR